MLRCQYLLLFFKKLVIVLEGHLVLLTVRSKLLFALRYFRASLCIKAWPTWLGLCLQISQPGKCCFENFWTYMFFIVFSTKFAALFEIFTKFLTSQHWQKKKKKPLMSLCICKVPVRPGWRLCIVRYLLPANTKEKMRSSFYVILTYYL